MDRLSKERRSWNMSRIRGKDTTPEILVRSRLHRLGYRFRLHRRDLPGNPDIVMPRFRIAIFVHGCFWHRHHNCRYAYTPKSRIPFWKLKFTQNQLRDRLVARHIRVISWRRIVVWECETADPGRLDEILLRRIHRMTGQTISK